MCLYSSIYKFTFQTNNFINFNRRTPVYHWTCIYPIYFQCYYIEDTEVKKLIKPLLRKEQLKITSKQIGFVENKKVNDLDVDIDLSFLDKL